MDTKKLWFLIAAIVVALMFISSYVSLTTYSSSQPQTTTIPNTVFGQAIINGIVTGYGTAPVAITVRCHNASYINSTASNVTRILNRLEGNNSIFNFYNTNMDFHVAMGNQSTYGMYTYFKG